MTAVMLAVTVMCGTVAGSYQEAQAAEIVAGIGALEIIEGILLSFGISVMTSEMIGTLTKDPDAAKQEEWNEIQAAFWQDQLEAQYEAARKKKMEAPSPTPEPDDDNKDKTIPTFKELMQKYKDTGKIVLGSAAGYGVWDCMKEAVGNLWDKMFGRASDGGGLTDQQLEKISASEYPCYVKYYMYDYIIKVYGRYSFIYNTDNVCCYPYGTKFYNADSDLSTSYYFNPDCKTDGFNNKNVSTNMPRFNTKEEGLEWQKQQVANADKYTKENIWVHPDLQETYQNNGKLEYPQEAPQPLNVPSIDQLTELATKLSPDTNPSYDPSMTPEYVAELIKQLQATETPDPQPTTKPDVNPTLAPNPTSSPTGAPEDPTPEEEASPYKADLREIFPFCIPFDLIHLLKVFDAEPEAPVFKFPLDLELDNPWTGEKVVDYHHEFEFDFSDYEDLIKLLRIIQIVAFITGLMMITRQQMIKG